MAKKEESELTGFTTIRIKNSTLRRLKYNDFYSDSLSEKIDYLITYWEATADHYHRRNLENLLHRIEDFNNEQPLEGFEGTINRLENLFAAGDLTYVIAEMTMETPSGFAGKQLYVTFYREDSSIHKDMKRHPFALLIISQGTFKFYIPLDKNCLTGIWSLKQVEKELEIPEWIEDKLIPESAKGREVTVGIEESYQRVIPG